MGQSISLKSPIQFAIYLTTQTYWGMIGLIIFGSILNFLSTFAIGRYILLSFPELFSFGTFKKSGPTQAQIENSSFTTTFYTKGSSNPDLINGIPCKLNFEMVVKVTGPEMGYVTTPICVVQCALLFLDGGVIPFGVHTPASAFSETDLISRLDRRGVKFTVVQEKLH